MKSVRSVVEEKVDKSANLSTFNLKSNNLSILHAKRKQTWLKVENKVRFSPSVRILKNYGFGVEWLKLLTKWHKFIKGLTIGIYILIHHKA